MRPLRLVSRSLDAHMTVRAPRSQRKPTVLAERRSLAFKGTEVRRTPLLVPSFSSKGFVSVQHNIDYSSESMDDAALISAYDLHYAKLALPENFAALLFLDSGGYEASKDVDLSDYGDREHRARTWTQEMHEAQLAKWRPGVPSVIISYDHPNERCTIRRQITRAEKMAPGRTDLMREFLIKPETTTQSYVQMPELLSCVRGVKNFDVIGVTEKEIGNSILSRMRNIARLRMALDKANIHVPIHVFGSLDPVTTPYYFLAGADIFDGLTWLRFAFHKGQTLYKQNFGGLHMSLDTNVDVIDGLCCNRNYGYIKELQIRMRRFLNTRDFDAFETHGSKFKGALESVMEEIGG